PVRVARAAVLRRDVGTIAALDTIPAGGRPYVAAGHSCPRNAYWERFRETTGGMYGHGMELTPEQVAPMVARTHDAPRVQDEAMAESIVAAREAHNTLVIHANGSFHSNYHLGTVERVKRRDRGARQVVVTFLPIEDLDAANGRSQRKMGDYIVFTLAPARAD